MDTQTFSILNIWHEQYPQPIYLPLQKYLGIHSFQKVKHGIPFPPPLQQHLKLINKRVNHIVAIQLTNTYSTLSPKEQTETLEILSAQIVLDLDPLLKRCCKILYNHAAIQTQTCIWHEEILSQHNKSASVDPYIPSEEQSFPKPTSPLSLYLIPPILQSLANSKTDANNLHLLRELLALLKSDLQRKLLHYPQNLNLRNMGAKIDLGLAKGYSISSPELWPIIKSLLLSSLELIKIEDTGYLTLIGGGTPISYTKQAENFVNHVNYHVNHHVKKIYKKTTTLLRIQRQIALHQPEIPLIQSPREQWIPILNKNLTQFRENASIPFISQYWHEHLTKTDPIDREKVKEHLEKFYATLSLHPPTLIYWQDTQWQDKRGLQFSPEQINTRIRRSLRAVLSSALPRYLEKGSQRIQDLAHLSASILYTTVQENLGKKLLLAPSLPMHTEPWMRQDTFGIRPLLTEWGRCFLPSVTNILLKHFLLEIYHESHKAIQRFGYPQQLEENLINQIGSLSSSSVAQALFYPSLWILITSLFDYEISIHNPITQPIRWLALKELVKEIGWILPFEKVCIIGNRPDRIQINPQLRFQAQGEPALTYTNHLTEQTQDYYYWDNLLLQDPRYHTPIQDWKSEWLISERNAEIRRMLVQGIGYSRLIEELEAREIDSWREYTLLRLEGISDIEAICLLKMTCPSTKFIHTLRVPPNIRRAKEAITWINHGIPPEEIIQET